jgi:heat shock protein HslJ
VRGQASLNVLFGTVLLIGSSGVQPAQTVMPALEDNVWKLALVGKQRVGTMRREPYLLLESATKRASGVTGCNQFTARYQLAARRLTFTRISYTRMACLEPIEKRIENDLLSSLESAREWRIEHRTLRLLDARRTVVAQFTPATARKDR